MAPLPYEFNTERVDEYSHSINAFSFPIYRTTQGSHDAMNTFCFVTAAWRKWMLQDGWIR